MRKDRSIKIQQQNDNMKVSFRAMASPCEVLIQTSDQSLANHLAHCICDEVWRIEDKYNRYDSRSICSQLNKRAGQKTSIDEETYLLFNFASQCFELSEGLFDITSGVLRQIWSFNGDIEKNSMTPSHDDVKRLLKHVGWQKVIYDKHNVTLCVGMELDFGGIGKEYAVDRAMLLANQQMLANEKVVPILINLGGDLAVNGSRNNDQAWQVAIESTELDGENPKSDNPLIVALKQGALATSGDTKRFFIKSGKRYGHIINGLTGWPVQNAPRSVTVASPNCTQAGVLASLALLQGQNAQQFLEESQVSHWLRK